MEKTISNSIMISMFVLIPFLYVMGIYSVFTEDYRYKTSHAVAAYLFPPYTIFVGSYELYDKMANSKAREYEDDCVIEKRIAGYKKDQIVAYCIDSKEFR